LGLPLMTQVVAGNTADDPLDLWRSKKKDVFLGYLHYLVFQALAYVFKGLTWIQRLTSPAMMRTICP